MSSAAMRGARAVWEARAGAPTRGDRLYVVYLAALTAAVVGIPAARAAMRVVARPDVLPLVAHPSASSAVTALWLAACAALVIAGRVRGPALLSPFFVSTLGSSAMPRGRVLLRPFLRSVGVLAACGGLLGAVVGGALVLAGRNDVSDAAMLAVGCAGAGLLAAALWLAGEVVGARACRGIAAGLLLAAGVVAWSALAAPLGIAHHTLPGSMGMSTALCIAGAVLVGVGITGLDRVRGEVLREQAGRWADATTTAVSGDVAAAAGVFRMPPTAGRRMNAVARLAAGATPLVLLRLYGQRDLVGILRTPERAAAALLGAIAGGAALAGAAAVTGPVRWVLVVIAALALHSAAGALLDGVRHAVATLGAPVLIRQGVVAQILLHLPVPALILAAGAAAGSAGIAVVAGDGPSPIIGTLALLGLVVAGRVRDAAKGPLPLRLTMPMPTAQGDASILGLLVWQADAPLLAIGGGVLVAAALTATTAAASTILWATTAALATVLIVGARGRVRRLRE